MKGKARARAGGTVLRPPECGSLEGVSCVALPVGFWCLREQSGLFHRTEVRKSTLQQLTRGALKHSQYPGS